MLHTVNTPRVLQVPASAADRALTIFVFVRLLKGAKLWPFDSPSKFLSAGAMSDTLKLFDQLGRPAASSAQPMNGVWGGTHARMARVSGDHKPRNLAKSVTVE
ncbi:MAG TPA: hypothetical protein VIN58_09990 [Roseateles sp.]